MFKVKDSPIHGKGCFAANSIAKGQTFTFPVIILDKKTIPVELKHFMFPWLPNQSSLVLSEITFCNTSSNPNFKILSIDKILKTKTFICLKDIEQDEEIFLRY